MAFNPSPKVADCRDIARRWKKQQVIVVAVDYKKGTLECVSYGETSELCAKQNSLPNTALMP